MPEKLVFHCSMKVNATTIMVLGGYTEGKSTEKTYFFNRAAGDNWIVGPELMKARYRHGCGYAFLRTPKGERRQIAIAVGGYEREKQKTKTTEVLRLDWNNPIWIPGPNLPNGIGIAAAVGLTTTDGRFLLIGGQKNYLRGNLGSILELNCDVGVGHNKGMRFKESCRWITMKQKLKQPRSAFLAMIVPSKKFVPECK